MKEWSSHSSGNFPFLVVVHKPKRQRTCGLLRAFPVTRLKNRDPTRLSRSSNTLTLLTEKFLLGTSADLPIFVIRLPRAVVVFHAGGAVVKYAMQNI
jgi:hypothetical protein